MTALTDALIEAAVHRHHLILAPNNITSLVRDGHKQA